MQGMRGAITGRSLDQLVRPCRRESRSATAGVLRKGVAKTPDSSGAFRRTRLAVCIGLGWRKHRPRHRKVPQIAFKPDWTRHAEAAPFKRNDAMLALPIGVMVFPGTGHPG
jgi:hypothetical protein